MFVKPFTNLIELVFELALVNVFGKTFTEISNSVVVYVDLLRIKHWLYTKLEMTFL